MLEGKIVKVRELQAGSIVELVDETAEGFKAQYAGKPPRIGIVEAKIPHFADGAVFLAIKGLRGRNFAPLTAPVPLNGNVRVLAGKPRETVLKAFNQYAKKHLGDVVAGSVGMTSGSDPEVFAVDAKGTIVPAFEFLPDKKTNPYTYWDGFQAEFSTVPRDCLAYHVDSIQSRLEMVHGALKAKFPKAHLTIQNVLEVPAKYLTDGKEEHVVLGCDPSENAYGLCGRPVEDGRKLPMRFAGGHLHFGSKLLQPEPVRERVITALDALVGVAGVSLAANIDRPVRRQYYGLPGEHRVPPHGLEYRALSNFWLCHPAITHLVFDLARITVNAGFAGQQDLFATDMDAVRACMVEHDVQLARKLIKANAAIYHGLFNWCYNSQKTRPEAVKYAMLALENGVEAVVKDPDDIAKNWLIGKGTWQEHSEGKTGCWKHSAAQLSKGLL